MQDEAAQGGGECVERGDASELGRGWEVAPPAVPGDRDAARIRPRSGDSGQPARPWLVVCRAEVIACRSGRKDAMLVRISQARLNRLEGAVREVVFPVAGGEQTLRDVVAEYHATQTARQARVRTVLEGSYSHHYRTMLPKLLDALEFRCNNSTYRPVMNAVELLGRYKDRDGRAKYYDPIETVPLDGVVPLAWRGSGDRRQGSDRADPV